MMEYDAEPIRGLPGRLPDGEHIIWQGAPDWSDVRTQVYRIRIVGSYFSALRLRLAC
jgi:hypothetical protein